MLPEEMSSSTEGAFTGRRHGRRHRHGKKKTRGAASSSRDHAVESLLAPTVTATAKGSHVDGVVDPSDPQGLALVVEKLAKQLASFSLASGQSVSGQKLPKREREKKKRRHHGGGSSGPSSSSESSRSSSSSSRPARRHRRHHRGGGGGGDGSSSSSSGSSSGSGSSSSRSHRGLGVTRKFRGVARIRRRCRHHPGRVVREFLHSARLELGVTSRRQHFHLRDLTVRNQPRFSQSIGLMKVHWYVGHVLQDMLICRRPKRAVAALIQLHKAVLQTAIDSNKWHTSGLLLPYPDILKKTEFGGSYEELSQIATYQRAIADLKNPGQAGRGEEVPAGGGPSRAAQPKAAGRGKAP